MKCKDCGSKRVEIEPLASPIIMEFDGPTLRDQFAMAALQGCLASPEVAKGAVELGISRETFIVDLTRSAYEYADAMLAARKNGGAA